MLASSNRILCGIRPSCLALYRLSRACMHKNTLALIVMATRFVKTDILWGVAILLHYWPQTVI